MELVFNIHNHSLFEIYITLNLINFDLFVAIFITCQEK